MANAALKPGALSKPNTGLQQRAADRKQAKANRVVYAAVTARDGGRCRACQTYCGIAAQRHHLRGRKITTTRDCCLVCEDCHGFISVRVGGKRMKLYGDADARNAFGALNGLTLETRQNAGAPIVGRGYIDRRGVQWRVEDGL